MSKTITFSPALVNGMSVICGDVATTADGSVGITNWRPGACAAAPPPPPPPPPGGVPANLQRLAWVSFGINQQDRAWVDITEWANIWGRGSMRYPATPWPGPMQSQPAILLNRDSCFAARLTVPADFPVKYGNYHRGNNPFGPPCDLSFSEHMGDFALPPRAGLVLNSPADLDTVLSWTSNPHNINPSNYVLAPTKTFYLNGRFSAPASLPPGDHIIYLQHTHG
jgi:hypothetical protein